jgi:hypothetical protein
MCDVEGLHELIFDRSKDPVAFVGQAKLRSTKTILDATELIVRIHWAIRDGLVNETPVPTNMNWKKPADTVPVRECPTCGVVAERHYALNWLIRFQDAEWDDVDIPT